MCVKGNGDNTNLSATWFCLDICKQESCIGERLLTHWRDIVALIQRMGVGVPVGRSTFFHVYREWVFSDCFMVHVTQMGFKQKKHVMPFWTMHNPLQNSIEMILACVRSDQDSHWHVSDECLVFGAPCICSVLDLYLCSTRVGFSSSGCLQSPAWPPTKWGYMEWCLLSPLQDNNSHNLGIGQKCELDEKQEPK